MFGNLPEFTYITTICSVHRKEFKLKKLTVGSKIRLGFGIVLSFFLFLAAWSYIGTGSVAENAEVVIYGNQLEGILAQKEVDHLNWAKQVTELLTNDDVTTLQVETDHKKCAFGKWLYGDQRLTAEKRVPSLSPLLKKIEKPHENLHVSAIEIGKVFRSVDHRLGWFLRERKSDHLAWLHELKDGLFSSEESSIDINTDPRQCRLGKWIYSAETDQLKKVDGKFAELLASLEPVHKALHTSAKEIKQKLEEGNRPAAIAYYKNATANYAEQTIAALDELRDWHDGLVELQEDAQAMYAYETIPALIELQDLLGEIRQEAKNHIMSDEAMLGAAMQTKTSIVAISAIALTLGCILAFFISRGIIRTLKSISSVIDQSATQVATASEQITSTNQDLANRASEQASSIEETSSSLEELSSMTSENAENARQADGHMKSAIGIIETADQAMEEMQVSMADITQASEETSKIIKTIDEIAFQTNLLALNAAVEAARAGEAGAGFAVVADEVRNLALRAADAARSTAELIEGTVKKVKNGSDLVQQTSESFARVATNATDVGDLVSEIAAASNEQAQGIGQINSAVNEMDKVVQQNAANAEESTGAAEELNNQAGHLKSVVEELLALIGGSKNSKDQRKENSIKSLIQGAREVIPVSKNNKTAKQLSNHQAVKISPVLAADMDEEDFNDF